MLSSDNTRTRPATRVRRWRRFAVVAAVLAAGLVPATAAHAQWYMSKRAAERDARHYASHYYANTYASDLTTGCRPSGEHYNRRYDYHRWVCDWYDSSDETSGTVLIVGSSSPGAYYGKVIHGAH